MMLGLELFSYSGLHFRFVLVFCFIYGISHELSLTRIRVCRYMLVTDNSTSFQQNKAME